jgi:hypothetical protein
MQDTTGKETAMDCMLLWKHAQKITHYEAA